MTPAHRNNLLVWLGLLILAGIEFSASFAPIPVGGRPLLIVPAVIMAMFVTLGYMRLLSAPQIARGFAIAGIFWLIVLLGLSSMDPLTRAFYAVVE